MTDSHLDPSPEGLPRPFSTEERPSVPARDAAEAGSLAAATRELALLGDHEAVLAALPRLARLVCGASGAEVVRARDAGAVESLATSGSPLSSRGAAVSERVRGALS